jgi:hypothetical protein
MILLPNLGSNPVLCLALPLSVMVFGMANIFTSEVKNGIEIPAQLSENLPIDFVSIHLEKSTRMPN